ncbi:MAG: hypothetical protein ABIY56_09605, partial [Dokdonella sp.]
MNQHLVAAANQPITRVSRWMAVPTVLVALMMAIPQAADAAIPTAERSALLALYTSTNGNGWQQRTGWMGSAGSECNWYGITCDATESHVTGIDLSRNALSGTLSPINGLTQLN